MLKQISVFVENKAGRLTAVMKTLNDAEIDTRALSIADTTDFGIVRLIVNNTEKALTTLKEKSFAAKVTSVIGFTIKDHSGALYEVIKLLNENGFNIEYSYSLMGKNTDVADIVIRTNDNEKAEELLVSNGINLISHEDIL